MSENIRKEKRFLDNFENRFEGKELSPSYLEMIVYFFLKVVLIAFCLLLLRPKKRQGQELNKKLVDEVYDKEAKNYAFNHHLTTRGQDRYFRREAGYFVLVNYCNREQSEQTDFVVLDLCTGTGLCLLEIDRVLNTYKSKTENLKSIGLDYNQKMLLEAERSRNKYLQINPNFLRGDATDLASKDQSLCNIKSASIDLVTHVFGMGGIDDPKKCLYEVLRVLKKGGKYFLVDMHSPNPLLPGDWFVYFQSPYIEQRVYREITCKYVLDGKWGWRDRSETFRGLESIVIKEGGKYYAFRINHFKHLSYRWWLAMPIMPVATAIVEKIELSEKQYLERVGE